MVDFPTNLIFISHNITEIKQIKSPLRAIFSLGVLFCYLKFKSYWATNYNPSKYFNASINFTTKLSYCFKYTKSNFDEN